MSVARPSGGYTITPDGLDAHNVELDLQALAAAIIPDNRGTSAPTGGTHRVGEILWHSAPAAAGKIGWVCVAAGSPGTWKAWGPIDA